MTINLGFLASGSGSGMEQVVQDIRSGILAGYNPKLIITDREQAGVYERASRLALPIERTRDDTEQVALAQQHGVDLMLAIGYLRMIGPAMRGYFSSQLWNIHPALLPKHGGTGMYGLRVHEAVLKARERVTGATVHVINDRYDDGAILNQIEVEVLPEDTPKTLQERVKKAEWQLMRETLQEYHPLLRPHHL